MTHWLVRLKKMASEHLLSLSLRSFDSLYLKLTREQVECESLHADMVVNLDQFVCSACHVLNALSQSKRFRSLLVTILLLPILSLKKNQ